MKSEKKYGGYNQSEGGWLMNQFQCLNKLIEKQINDIVLSSKQETLIGYYDMFLFCFYLILPSPPQKKKIK